MEKRVNFLITVSSITLLYFVYLFANKITRFVPLRLKICTKLYIKFLIIFKVVKPFSFTLYLYLNSLFGNGVLKIDTSNPLLVRISISSFILPLSRWISPTIYSIYLSKSSFDLKISNSPPSISTLSKSILP